MTKRKFNPALMFDVLFGLFMALAIMCFLVCIIMMFMTIGKPLPIVVEGVLYPLEVWWLFLIAGFSGLISFGFLALICYGFSYVIEKFDKAEEDRQVKQTKKLK